MRQCRLCEQWTDCGLSGACDTQANPRKEEFRCSRVHLKSTTIFPNCSSARFDAALYEQILANAENHGLPAINISASEGMLLHVLVRAIGAKRVLEIGTLGGYSGTWLASALPAGGRLVTLEIDEKHATAARENFELAKVSDRVEIRLGPASETLDAMIASAEPLFDITFIDADKPSYTGYLAQALKLTRPGGLILADNTLSHGVLDGTESGISRYNAAASAESRLTSAIVATMRDDIDGLMISVVE